MLIGIGQRLSDTDGTQDITIDGTSLELVSCVKYLGINIDNTLNWGNQVQAICKNLFYQISKLKHLSKFMNKELLTQFIKSLYSHVLIMPYSLGIMFDYE